MAVKFRNPDWWAEDFRLAHAAGEMVVTCLTGNVDDYVVPGIDVPTFLAEKFRGFVSVDPGREGGVFVFYDLGGGISFPKPRPNAPAVVREMYDAMRERAYRVWGLNQPTAEDDAALAGSDVEGDEEIDLSSLGVAASLRLLEQLLEANIEVDTPDGPVEEPMPVVIVIRYADKLVPQAETAMLDQADRRALVKLQSWADSRELKMRGAVIMLLAPSMTALHQDLREQVKEIRIPRPDADQREQFVRWWTTQRPVGFSGDLDLPTLVRQTAGLKAVQLESALAMGDELGGLSYNQLLARRQELIRTEFGDQLEIQEAERGWEGLAGYDHVKFILMSRVVWPMLAGDLEQVPSGILIPGPAGVGKSVAAVCLAAEAGGLPVLKLKASRMVSMWQGQGERQTEQILAAFDAQEAGCVIIIEEADALFRRVEADSSGGGQQNMRVFSLFLDWLGKKERRGKSVPIAITNRPDLMDPAMTRPGRFSLPVPMLLPLEPDRHALFRLFIRDYMGAWVDEKELAGIDGSEEWGELVALTDGWTGAEIELIPQKANQLLVDGANVKRYRRRVRDLGFSLPADFEARAKLTPLEALMAAARTLKPTTRAVREMEKLALQFCNDPELVPPVYRDRWNEAQGARTPLEGRRELPDDVVAHRMAVQVADVELEGHLPNT